MAGKNTSVYGIYRNRIDLEHAVDTLRAEGFRSTATGASTGAVVGGILGWLTGIGAGAEQLAWNDKPR